MEKREGEEKELDGLPPSNDPYWKEAEREMIKVKGAEEHTHFFVQALGEVREAKCKCGLGLFLGPGDEIEDGHLYFEGQLVY